jgi:hypothetical protein
MSSVHIHDAPHAAQGGSLQVDLSRNSNAAKRTLEARQLAHVEGLEHDACSDNKAAGL